MLKIKQSRLFIAKQGLKFSWKVFLIYIRRLIIPTSMVLRHLLAAILTLGLSLYSFGQNSLFLDNSPEYVNIGDLDVAGDQLTVEALIHYTGASVNVVSKHSDPSNVNYLLRIGSFEITTTSGFANFSGTAAAGVTLNPGVTYHVAATYNGQFLRYYVNGCLTGELAWTGNMITNDLDAVIGNQSTNEAEQFNGYIDEVRIWNVARSQVEIASNMLDLPTPAAQPGLQAYYKFTGNLINEQGNPAWNGVAVNAIGYQPIPYPYPTEIGVTATSSPVICEGTPTGAIDIAGNGGYLPYSYSTDGVTFVPTSDFSGLTPGDYNVFVRSNDNCVASTTVTIADNPALESNIDTTDISCNGFDDGQASINPSGGNGPGYHFEWYDGNTTDLSIDNLAPGNYSVLVGDSCKQSGNELVLNGHFENGNSDFTSDYTYCSDCYANNNDLPGGEYLVGFDAAVHHNNFQGLGNGGEGNFLMVNGAEIPNTNVWCQTITVNPNTHYVFSSWVTSIHPDSPAQLQFSVNGVALGPVFNAPNAVNVWDQFFSTWFSGASTTATICIVNQNTDPAGNDFGLDDISFKACVSCEQTLDFAIDEPTLLEVDLTVNNELCGGNNGQISANVSGGTAPYEYNWNNSGFGTETSIDNLTAGSYSLVVRDANGCEIEFNDIAVTNEVTTVDANLSSLPNSACLECNYDGPSIMINELMISPATFDGSLSGFGGVGDGRGEWIELYNPNWCDSVDISCYYLGNSAPGDALAGTQSGGYVIPQGTIVPPLGFALIRGVNAAPVDPTLLVENGGNVVELIVPAEVTDPGICVGPSATRLWFPNAGGWFAFYDAQGVPQDAVRWGTGNVADLAGAPCVAQSGTCDFTGELQSYNAIPDENKTHASTADGSSHVGQSIRRIPDGEDWNGTGAPTYATCNDPNDCLAETGISFCNGQATATPTSGTAPFTYQWNDPANQTTQTALNLCAGDYEVIVTDANGCSETFTITVEEDLFTISAVGIDPTCAATDGSITVTTSEPGTYEYVWSNNTGITDTETTTAAGLGSDIYSVAVTSGGCTRDTTILLAGPPIIEDINTLIVPTSCGLNNGSITIESVVGGTAPFEYNFNNQGNSTTTQYDNLTPGTYSILVDDAAGCDFEVTNLVVDPSVGIEGFSYTTTPSTCDFNDGTLQITNVEQGNPDFTYFLNNTEGDFGFFESLGFGNYTLLIVDSENCTFESTVEVPLAFTTEDIFVPNVFTPNNDQSNDFWFIGAECVEEFECTIFNRWGNTIFRYTDIAEVWNGNDLNSNAVGEGVYFYKARVKFFSGNQEELHGHITLVRE